MDVAPSWASRRAGRRGCRARASVARASARPRHGSGAASVAVPVDSWDDYVELLRRLRGAGAAAARGAVLLRPGRPAGLRRAGRARLAGGDRPTAAAGSRRRATSPVVDLHGDGAGASVRAAQRGGWGNRLAARVRFRDAAARVADRAAGDARCSAAVPAAAAGRRRCCGCAHPTGQSALQLGRRRPRGVGWPSGGDATLRGRCSTRPAVAEASRCRGRRRRARRSPTATRGPAIEQHDGLGLRPRPPALAGRASSTTSRALVELRADRTADLLAWRPDAAGRDRRRPPVDRRPRTGGRDDRPPTTSSDRPVSRRRRHGRAGSTALVERARGGHRRACPTCTRRRRSPAPIDADAAARRAASSTPACVAPAAPPSAAPPPRTRRAAARPGDPAELDADRRAAAARWSSSPSGCSRRGAARRAARPAASGRCCAGGARFDSRVRRRLPPVAARRRARTSATRWSRVPPSASRRASSPGASSRDGVPRAGQRAWPPASSTSPTASSPARHDELHRLGVERLPARARRRAADGGPDAVARPRNGGSSACAGC